MLEFFVMNCHLNCPIEVILLLNLCCIGQYVFFKKLVADVIRVLGSNNNAHNLVSSTLMRVL